MDKEIQALLENGTWDIVSLPKGKMRVYKATHKVDGSLERLRARFVVRGFTQKAGIDYVETFSPIVKMTTVRVMLSVVVKRGWKVH